MKHRRRFRTIVLLVLLAIVLLQFIPVDRSAPPVNPAQDFLNVQNAPVSVASLMRSACYDCHSNETRYPWYAYIAPVSFWLQNHIREGRENLNFSTWTLYNAEDLDEALEEMIEVVKEKSMPLNSYLWGHPEARLTDAQRQEMTTWFQSLRKAGDD